MLVLSRKVGQTIVVDNNISIHVVQISGGSVRLGIEAPSHIRILRGELDRLESDESFSSLVTGKDEPLESSLPETAADSQVNRPNSRADITGAHPIDVQQLLRQTDLLQ